MAKQIWLGFGFERNNRQLSFLWNEEGKIMLSETIDVTTFKESNTDIMIRITNYSILPMIGFNTRRGICLDFPCLTFDFPFEQLHKKIRRTQALVGQGHAPVVEIKLVDICPHKHFYIDCRPVNFDLI